MNDSCTYIGPLRLGESLSLLVAPSKIACGFPSAAEDWIEDKLDLNERLIKSAPSTFIFRTEGHSMVGQGINDGDLLVVDRALTPRHGKIVVASFSGELTVKQLDLKTQPPRLLAANPDYPPLVGEFSVWGVVTASITEF